MLKTLQDFLLPPQCQNCSDRVVDTHSLCGDCFSKIKFISNQSCNICGYPKDYAEEATDQCHKNLEYLDGSRSAVLYGDVIKKIILSLKYGDATQKSLYLGKLILKTIKEQPPLSDIDYMMPIPLHWMRIFNRQYNQSTLIAKTVQKELKTPLLIDVLRRHKKTKIQKNLTVEERHNNLSNAFSLNPKKKNMIKGKRILLIDDVMTSGLTFDHCAKVLKESGADKVYAVSVARVPIANSF